MLPHRLAEGGPKVIGVTGKGGRLRQRPRRLSVARLTRAFGFCVVRTFAHPGRTTAVIGELDVFLSRLCVALNKKQTRRKTCFPKEETVLLLPSFAVPNHFHEVSSVLHKSARFVGINGWDSQSAEAAATYYGNTT